MKLPLIGITGNYGSKGCELAEGYYKSILQAGGVPVVLPPFENRDALKIAIESIDGLLLSGGGDLNPLLIGEEPVPELHSVCPQRDKAELMLIEEAVHRQMPILGICRGIQMMVTALGGTLYQDLSSQYDQGTLLKHDQDMPREYASHSVEIEEDSFLYQIMGQQKSVSVNSFHHQAVKDPGPRMRVAARAKDGVIEAVESNEYKSLMGVQWHPECFILKGNSCMLPIFQWLVEESSSYAKAKEIHRKVLTFDSHCDTPMFFHEGVTLGDRDSRIKVDIPKMEEGLMDACVMVAYLPQKERDEASLKRASEKAESILTQIKEKIRQIPQRAEIAYTPADLYRLKEEGKRGIMLGIENGYAIGKNLSLLKHFRDQGIVYMTLCHNGDNDICDSARGNNEHNGLSAFGREVVQEMNKLGIMIDLSHASEKSFYDALEESQMPIVCSHSSSRLLCDHPRNLTDDQMRALAAKDGVAQLTLYHGFLRTAGEATIQDAMKHLRHMVDTMGIEHVGFGSDFDGDGGVKGLNDASEAINFTRQLLAQQFNKEDIRLLWGGNFLRLMEKIQKAI